MKLKVTFLTLTGVYPNLVGGPAVFLYNFNLKLKNLGIDSEIIDFSNLKRIKHTFYKIFHTIKQVIGSDVIIFNSPPNNLLFLMLILGKLLRKKVFFICHGGIFVELKGLSNQINRSILLLGIRFHLIDYTVVPSKWLSKFIAKFYKIRQLLTIPNGIDVDEIKSHPAEQLPTPNNLIFVGRLSRIKGIQTLIEAFALVNEVTEAHLYIVGPRGNLVKRELNQMKLIQNVHFMGQVSHARKISLIKGSDIVIIPSLWENFPVILLEAMACAKPIITTSVGGIPEIITQKDFNGILIEPANKEILSKTIKTLLSDKEKRAQLSKNAFNTAKTRYNWNKIVFEYLKFIKNNKSD